MYCHHWELLITLLLGHITITRVTTFYYHCHNSLWRRSRGWRRQCSSRRETQRIPKKTVLIPETLTYFCNKDFRSKWQIRWMSINYVFSWNKTISYTVIADLHYLEIFLFNFKICICLFFTNLVIFIVLQMSSNFIYKSQVFFKNSFCIFVWFVQTKLAYLNIFKNLKGS